MSEIFNFMTSGLKKITNSKTVQFSKCTFCTKTTLILYILFGDFPLLKLASRILYLFDRIHSIPAY